MKILIILACGVIVLCGGDDSSNYFENNVFPVKLYKAALKSNYGSFLISPVSLQIMFALLLFGGSDMTALEIIKAFEFPEYNRLNKEIFTNLTSTFKDHGSYTINSVNKIYLQDGYVISEAFKSVAKEAFATEVENIDFNHGEAAIKKINNWVKSKLHKSVRHLLNSDFEIEDANMVLINTIFFQGDWFIPFNKSKTEKHVFYVNAEDYVDVELMQHSGLYQYHKSEELKAQFLKMWYGSYDVSLTIILPDDREGLPALEKALLDNWSLPVMDYMPVKLSLPKFKTTSTIDYVPVLKEMGIQAAFERYEGFDKISSNNTVYASHVLQKTIIKVDEKGTLSAEGVAVEVVDDIIVTSGDLRDLINFEVNHPFMYYITSSISGATLFMGRLTTP